MRWYNRHLFNHIGNRRLLTAEEFAGAVMAQFHTDKLRVIERRQHELLLDIAANANALMNNSPKPAYKTMLESNLRSALMSYKIVEQDAEAYADPPPSTNAREAVLMELP